MELPSIQSFKLNNILNSIQDDSIDQLVQSIVNVSNNFSNDLNQELLELIQFQSNNINSILIRNIKLIKNFKPLRTSPDIKLDDELYNAIANNSKKTKDLIEKLYKFEKLLPVKERLFNDTNSHKLHYPALYEAGSKILDFNDDLVSLDENSIDEEVGQEEGVAKEEVLEDNNGLNDPIEENVTENDPEDTDTVQENLQSIYNTARREEDKSADNLKDRRISMLSKNIDDIISERAQQQQLQSMTTNPASFIFPTQLTKKTASQFNEDVRAILIKDPSEERVIFGLKKFL